MLQLFSYSVKSKTFNVVRLTANVTHNQCVGLPITHITATMKLAFFYPFVACRVPIYG